MFKGVRNSCGEVDPALTKPRTGRRLTSHFGLLERPWWNPRNITIVWSMWSMSSISLLQFWGHLVQFCSRVFSHFQDNPACNIAYEVVFHRCLCLVFGSNAAQLSLRNGSDVYSGYYDSYFEGVATKLLSRWRYRKKERSSWYPIPAPLNLSWLERTAPRSWTVFCVDVYSRSKSFFMPL